VTPNELSAVEASRRILAGDLSSEMLVRACLDRIAAREPQISAWSYIDPEAALAEARERDGSEPLGPLHGIPVAVKDVIDVRGMPTGMGSAIYKDYRPFADASCVATLRAAGAVILGKTVTAEFAGVAPGPTRNPLALSRTPGGSSSGSAAALADNMTPVAFGTQTGGSILRPASYCGVVGFKPTYNTVNRAGLKFAAESFDTIGLMARNVADVSLIWRVLVGQTARDTQVAAPLTVALFRTQHWNSASPETVEAINAAADRLTASGTKIDEIPVPDGFEALTEARKVINDYERARALAWEWQHHRDQISPALAAVVTHGRSIPYDDYLRATKVVAHWRGWLGTLMAGYDALLTPAADGEAPQGLESTGRATFQQVWTMLHAPSISLPLWTGPNGLPVGVQLVGKLHGDDALLDLAHWMMQIAPDIS
jgi:Asp-tRNA(Asn)/Glu-tRNA(Gln) amidotransferase A subunit family amidase